MISEAIPVKNPVHMGVSVWIGDKEVQEVLSLEIEQQYAAHDTLKLRCYQDKIQHQDTMYLNGAENLLGQVTEVILNDRISGKEALKSLFVISKVSFEHHALNEGILLIEGYAPTRLLDAGPHYESFYRQNLSSIVRTVTRPLEKVKAELLLRPTLNDTLAFVCRFGESAWNFLKRLSMETGQWLYFNGKSLVFGEPESAEAPDLVYGQNCIKLSLTTQTSPVTAGLIDYEPTGNEVLTQASNSDASALYTDRAHAFSKSKDIYGTDSYRYPAALPANRSTLATVGTQQAAVAAADMYEVSGESTLPELRMGIIARLLITRAGEVVQHTPVRIVSVRHVWDITGHYYNEFRGINAQSPVPPAVSYQQPATAPLVAQVISNADPSGQGRVQVKFLGWQQQHSLQQTDWIRVLTPDAGSSDKIGTNRGYVFIPETGDQVMVAFEHNNPDRPYVQGSIFHGANGAGGYNENHLKSIYTRSGNRILMNDQEGSIRIEDPSGNVVLMDGKGNIEVTAPKNIKISAGEDITLTAGKNVKVIAGKDMDINVSDNLKEVIGKDYSHISDNQTLVANKNKTEQIGDTFRQISGDANIQTTKGDLLVRGTGLAVLQGGNDVKISKG